MALDLDFAIPLTQFPPAGSFEGNAMSLSAQSKLYFVAAALFLAVVAIGLSDRGFELRAVWGVIMAGMLVALGLKARTVNNG